MPALIPPYPASRAVELADRDLFRGLFRSLQPVISEFSFGNLFLFRHVHRYAVATLNDSLVVSGCGYDGAPYFLPPLSGNRGETARRLLADGHSLYGVDEDFLAAEITGHGHDMRADRDNDDYLYHQSDLAVLPGSRFHKKKNRINYFSTRHPHSIAPFAAPHLPGALELLAEWSRIHAKQQSASLAAETAAAREALEHAASLELSGVVVLTAAGIVAFALGEPLNDTTIVCHFEKAHPFLEGAAQLVNREFSRRFPGYLYINRGQDLGESGMREAKNSYHPVAMIRKFRIVPHQRLT